MSKVSASILVFLALFAFVGAEQFQTFNFDQGRLRLRSLATTSLKTFDYINYTNTTAVNVGLGAAYLERAKIDTTTTKTDMMILLAGSSTGFCSDCSEFVNFQCADNVCAAETTKDIQNIHPFYSIRKANPFTLNVTIGADATAWQLKSSALLYTYNNKAHNYWSYPGASLNPYYITNYTTYGFIGMGIDGDSALNFVGDHPLFSVSVTGAGAGQLIFGKDSSKIDTTKTSAAYTTTTNWTMPLQNISIGTYNEKFSYVTTLIFDLNYPGLGLPSSHYSYIISQLTTKNGVVSDRTYNNSQYDYIYKGDLANLPNVNFILSNGQNFTIPAEAYTRKLAEGVYNILLQSVSSVYSYEVGSGQTTYYGVLGWSVMSHYYTVFEKTATGSPTITLYPNFGTSSGSNTPTTTTSNWKTILIVIVLVLVALVVISLALKKKNNLTKSDLGVELRAARV